MYVYVFFEHFLTYKNFKKNLFSYFLKASSVDEKQKTEIRKKIQNKNMSYTQKN